LGNKLLLGISTTNNMPGKPSPIQTFTVGSGLQPDQPVRARGLGI